MRTLLLVLLLTACHTPPARSPGPARPSEPAGPFAWTLGTWHGHRIHAADGSRAPMTLRVEPILGGAGQARHIEIDVDGDTYRGFSADVLDPERGVWVRRYANAVRGRFAELECVPGEAEAGDLWRGVSPTRTRESHILSVREGPHRWRRTMRVSEDGGATWRDLWIDELERP